MMINKLFVVTFPMELEHEANIFEEEINEEIKKRLEKLVSSDPRFDMGKSEESTVFTTRKQSEQDPMYS